MANTLRPNPVLENQRPRPTGSLIVAIRSDVDYRDAVRVLEQRTQAPVNSSTLSAANLSGLSQNAPVVFIEDLHVAFIPRHIRERSSTLMQTLNAEDMFVEVRPEFYLFKQQEFTDTAASTWGVAATRAIDSPYTGKGIKLCILDTGIDRDHPDFIQRDIVDKSFIKDEDIDGLRGTGRIAPEPHAVIPQNPTSSAMEWRPARAFMSARFSTIADLVPKAISSAV